MKENSSRRREFIKGCFAAAASLGFKSESLKTLSPRRKRFVLDAKEIPTRVLGKTGVRVPVIVFGGGSRFCSVKDPEKSAELLTHALDNGFYYWDTAHDYVYEGVSSEERYGSVLKKRRKEVFLSTKVQQRTYDGVMQHLEESLKRLQTDWLDLYQIHTVESMEDVARISAKGGAYEALQKLKEEKVTRFIGYTGHRSAQAMMELARRHEFDTMLVALNHYADRTGDLEGDAIPEAAEKRMGVLVMKVIRPRENVKSVTPEELIQYALSLPYVSAAVIGTDSLEVLKKNLALARDFTPLGLEEKKRISGELRPFFRGQSLAWMKAGYQDGNFIRL